VTWLVWRQHRVEALAAALLVVPTLALVAIFFILAQPMVHLVNSACPGDSCSSTGQAFLDQFGTLRILIKGVLIGLPVFGGLFIGAPLLAREFEQGTDQLVWSQGITRRHWLFVKLGLVSAVIVLLAASLAVAGHIWFEAQPATNSSQWQEFDIQGPAYVSYAFFSLALGITAGAAIGRTVPAMAVALIGYVGVRLAIVFLARPNFLPPLQWDVSTNLAGQLDAWMLGDQKHFDLQGHALSDSSWQSAVNTCSQIQGPWGSCLRDHGAVVLQAYQPGDRFWLFQSIEAAIFVSLGIVLLGLTVWVVGRRS
jgi:hypothetical protein